MKFLKVNRKIFRVGLVVFGVVVSLCIYNGMSSKEESQIDDSSINEAITDDNTYEDTSENAYEEETYIEDTQDIENDKKLLSHYGTTLLDTMSMLSNKMGDYCGNNDIASLVLYSSAFLDEYKSQGMDETVNSKVNEFKTEEYKNMYIEISDIFNDYIDMMENISNGNLDEDVINDIYDLRDRLLTYKYKAEGML